MDGLIFPILIASAVALMIWGLGRIIADANRGEKKKLSRRLSTEGQQQTSGIGGSGEYRPITIQLDVLGVPEALAKYAFIQSLNRKLVQAYPTTTLGRFLSIAFATGFFGLSIGYLLTGSEMLAVPVGLLGLYIPFFFLNSKRSKRQRAMAQQLPEALDFLSRILKAGHSFSTGLQMMGEELPVPLCEEFRRCYDQHSLGQPLEDALKEMSQRIDSTDFAFFVTALLIQRQTGGDLSEVLRNISGMIRGRVRLAQQVKSKTAEGRFTGYILVAFPAVMFCLCWMQNPDYCGKLLHGTGLYFLGVAFTLQMLGLWAIRKITTIRV